MNWKSFGMGLVVGGVGMFGLAALSQSAENEAQLALTQKFILEAEERGTKMPCRILRHGLDGRKASSEWVSEWQEAMKCRADWKF